MAASSRGGGPSGGSVLVSSLGVLAALTTAGVLAVTTTPRPGALVIRSLFDRDAARRKRALWKHSPPGIERVADQQYGTGDAATVLDVYHPRGLARGKRLPTVFWIHGGAWISGSRADASPYFRILASHGYTVVAPDYSVGPERRYPTAVFQLNRALQYVQDEAARLHVDTGRIVLAGDSAGAQLASQLATVATAPDYAAELGITPALAPERLVGAVLACGVYDLAALGSVHGLVGWGFDTAMRAYSGERRYASLPGLAQMSTIQHVTADFPPAFITGGNGDGLTDVQSRPFAARLASLGVPTTTLFHPEDHVPALPHEYQFTLDTAEGREALERIVAFLDERTG